jgi:hypothetical protein
MIMSSNRVIRAGILLGVFGFASINGCWSAAARTPFDGDWSVMIVTSNGACAASYRSGVQIANGAVISGGGLVDLQGQVTPKGAVRVTVQSGSQWANGYGHLTKTRGGGQWRGQGTSGSCSGSWIAERR